MRNHNGFDYDRLRLAVSERKGLMTLREVREQSGILEKTVCWFLLGKTQKLMPETIAKYCAWLGVPVESFLRGGPPPSSESTLDKIDAAMERDPVLTMKHRHALSDMMRAAYASLRS